MFPCCHLWLAWGRPQSEAAAVIKSSGPWFSLSPAALPLSGLDAEIMFPAPAGNRLITPAPTVFVSGSVVWVSSQTPGRETDNSVRQKINTAAAGDIKRNRVASAMSLSYAHFMSPIKWGLCLYSTHCVEFRQVTSVSWQWAATSRVTENKEERAAGPGLDSVSMFWSHCACADRNSRQLLGPSSPLLTPRPPPGLSHRLMAPQRPGAREMPPPRSETQKPATAAARWWESVSRVWPVPAEQWGAHWMELLSDCPWMTV